jgi:hypothetical protein
MVMRELRTEIEIDAAPERVWTVLVDFSRHAEWNPFIRDIEGEPLEGERLSIRIEPPGGKAMRFRPTVLTAVPSQELRWLGRLGFPGIFDGEHIYTLGSLDSGERTRLIHREEFRGLLVPLFWKNLDAGTRRGFEEMNVALKKRVEEG